MSVIGTIKLVAYDFTPRGYLECDGTTLDIESHKGLYSIIGTTYGGNGETSFKLPDLAGRAPVHQGDANKLGDHGGSASVTLTNDTLAQHVHPILATEAVADKTDPTGNMLATGSSRGTKAYVPLGTNSKVNMVEHAMSETGGGEAHNNMQPYLALRFVIAKEGTLPFRNNGLIDDAVVDYVGDVRMMAINFAPRNWAECNGQLMDISSNQSLFSLLGTTFGGDGRKTFGLPDLRGRVPINVGTHDSHDYVRGQKGGEESVSLTVQEIPSHFHQLDLAQTDATTENPGGNMLAANAPVFSSGNTNAEMAASTVGEPAGAGAAHDNMMPFMPITFCVCTNGLFPSRDSEGIRS